MTASEILRADASILGADRAAGFRTLARAWHPDVCKDPQAAQVLAHLIYLRDGGPAPAEEHVTVPGGQIVWREHEIVVVPGGADPFTALRATHVDLAKRLPILQAAAPEALIYMRPERAVSLAAVQRRYPSGVPAVHVAWMASRLYELVYVSQGAAAMTWIGLLPEMLCVLVEAHGVLPLDGRFLAPVGADLRGRKVPAALVPLVPADRRASVAFALATVNRIALILLGDPSGTGNALLVRAKADPKQLPPAFLAWFRARPSSDAWDFYKRYRALLVATWGAPKYHKLEV